MGDLLIFSANWADFVFQRDVLFSGRSNKSLRMKTTINRTKRNFIELKSFWWNSTTIPYMLDKSLGKFLSVFGLSLSRIYFWSLLSNITSLPRI